MLQSKVNHTIGVWSVRGAFTSNQAGSRSYRKQNVPSIEGSKTAWHKARELERSATVTKIFIA